MLSAKDIMTIDVFAVKKDTPVCEAIEVMLTHEVAGLPVVGENDELLGVITEKDALEFYNADPSELKRPVEDFMTSPAVFFDENEPLPEICRCLQTHTFRRVPVTSNGKVVGVISRPDVLKHILSQAGL